MIQLGAILSVVFLYFNRIKNDFELRKRIIVAFIPTGIIGFVLYKIIKQYLFNPHIVAASLIIGGILIIIENSMKKRLKQLRICRNSAI